MKNTKIILGISLIILFLFSCKKENITPSTAPTTIQKDSLSLWGTWKVVGGSLFLTNYGTGEMLYYSHFGPGRTRSSLRIDGSLFPIEDIIQDSTIYRFVRPLVSSPNMSSFYLNNDNIPYGLSIMGSNLSIVENNNMNVSPRMGGSSRPISITLTNYKTKTIYLFIETVITSINGYSCQYFSCLILQKISEN